MISSVRSQVHEVHPSGRRALITGASAGLGLAAATAFVEAGHQVMIAARGIAGLESAKASLFELYLTRALPLPQSISVTFLR